MLGIRGERERQRELNIFSQPYMGIDIEKEFNPNLVLIVLMDTI
jgi:hypothetical protein